MTFSNGYTTDYYKRIDLGTYPHLIVFNDDVANDLAFSVSGYGLDGIIRAGEGVEFRDANAKQIYVKSYISGQAVSYRIWSYGIPLGTSITKTSGFDNVEVPKNINTSFNIIKGVPNK